MTETEICVSALKKAPAERAAYLDAVCGADAGLRERVDAALDEYHRSGQFASKPPSKTPSRRIGRYKLVQRLGEGGMGEVWLAEQFEPIQRKVALKLIKPGLANDQVLARFEAERQALGLMEHPNIAKVLDAGLAGENQPYFVMELVKGKSITDYCDAKKLTIRERLILFQQVCQAIQHAHGKGIIHRDLKPTNILVEQYDQRPIPKVIDFGLAKAMGLKLTEGTLFSGFGSVVGTPAYMSPEQASFSTLEVDARSDVYSLGVVLYELVAGVPPFDPARLRNTPLDDLFRIIREEPIPPPSVQFESSAGGADIAARRKSTIKLVQKDLGRDISGIIMKCLEKDPAHRYQSVGDLLRDLRQYVQSDAKTGSGLKWTQVLWRLAALVVFGLTAAQAIRATLLLDSVRQDPMGGDPKSAAAIIRGLRRDLYLADMSAAQQAVDAGNWTALAGILDRLKTAEFDPHRSFEWAYFTRCAQIRDKPPVQSASLSVTSASLSRTLSVAAGDDVLWTRYSLSKVDVVRAFSGQAVFSRSTGSLPFTALSADGRLLVAVASKKLQVFSATSESPVVDVPINAGTTTTNVSAVAISPDSARVAVLGTDRRLSVFEVPSGAEAYSASLTESFTSALNAGLAFAPDHRRLAIRTSASDVVIVDLDARSVHKLKDAGVAKAICFSRDGASLLVGDSSGRLSIHDLSSSNPPRSTADHASEITSIAVSPDGNGIATSTADGDVAIYDAATLRPRCVLKLKSSSVRRIMFNADGSALVAVAYEERRTTIRPSTTTPATPATPQATIFMIWPMDRKKAN